MCQICHKRGNTYTSISACCVCKKFVSACGSCYDRWLDKWRHASELLGHETYAHIECRSKEFLALVGLAQ